MGEEETSSALRDRIDLLKSEYQILKRKFDSKVQALMILSDDLNQCREERDQFKLIAEQSQERHAALKQQLDGTSNSKTSSLLENDFRKYGDMDRQSLIKMLVESKELSKTLRLDKEDLKQKLKEAQGDIKLLREQIGRQRMGTSDEGLNSRLFPAHEREELVSKLEECLLIKSELDRDLRQVIDQKEELETERDAYKTKFARLNEELNYILRGDSNNLVDIDALIMENKYLQERLKQMEEEKSLAMATVSKYKNVLSHKKPKTLRVGAIKHGGLVVTQKQAQRLLYERLRCDDEATISDLQALACALLENLNDKSMALSHQRKTNKLLGQRIADLEKKLKTLEISGLWNTTEKAEQLGKLKLEYEEVRESQQELMSMSMSPSHEPTQPDDVWSPTHTPHNAWDELEEAESEASFDLQMSPVDVRNVSLVSAAQSPEDIAEETAEDLQEVEQLVQSLSELSAFAADKCCSRRAQSEDPAESTRVPLNSEQTQEYLVAADDEKCHC